MVSNIANRNVSLIFAMSSFVGLLYCIYSVIFHGSKWIGLCPIVISTCIFTKFYLTYRREIKRGNIYGKVNPFR